MNGNHPFFLIMSILDLHSAGVTVQVKYPMVKTTSSNPLRLRKSECLKYIVEMIDKKVK